MDIPDDVMRAAKAEIAKGDMAFITVARAILAERRRCADVAKARAERVPLKAGDMRAVIEAGA